MSEHVRPVTPIRGGTTLVFPDGREYPADAVPDLLAALEEADVALSLLVEISGVWDDCGAIELCGNSACEQIGCLCLKRDANRASLAKAKEDTP